MEIVVERICKELSLPKTGVVAVAALLNEGNTVPFIARYRKEATGSLDEVAIRSIEERAAYFKELLERRETVVKTIEKAGKLSPELSAKIENAWTKTELEDLYLPYKPKKRTKASIARDIGLESLLDELLADETGADPLMLSSPYVKEEQEGLQTPSACLEGAGYILAERLTENSEIRAWLRQEFFDHGTLMSAVKEERKEGNEAKRFKPYWDYKEGIKKIPPHRVLAIRRGEKEDILSVKLVTDREKHVSVLASKVRINQKSGYIDCIRAVCEDAFDRLLAPAMETDVRVEAKKRADAEAIKVFQTNLDHLLLAPPAGPMCTLGIDPGIRTGCKLAVINRLGQFMETATVYPLEPKRDLEGTRAVLDVLAERYPIEAITVGDGTGGRETLAIIQHWLAETGRDSIACVSISEAGASVYSASEVAREEFPDLDLTVRGAISIARRFQDPLAELVKVEPKSIGVGQYQHDVNQSQLKKGLDDSVESCVNRVGVDLNSASYKLLAYVAGIGETLAKNIVQWRYENGAFKKREQLMDVPRFGEKAFLQAAGFLRIRAGENPLDASAVHPESYPVVERICQLVGMTVPELIGNESLLDSLDPKLFIDDQFGLETVADIISEIKKPGRDPRQKFEPVQFNEGIHKPSDLEIGMELRGVVTNVTDFGAFVNIGVHQDGLVHLSEIGHTFIKHPSQALSVGQPVQVKVVAIDFESKRIGLSIKALAALPQKGPTRRHGRPPTMVKANRAGRPDRPPKQTINPQMPAPPSEKSQGKLARPASRPEKKERPIKPRMEAVSQVDQTPPSSATLDELMAKFNRGLR
ncbi:MAG: RNA-binding transcriptional accessory protein [Holophagaceae bacterium]|nr:RNA-binding transcriptional accessory protein [Holophagaceae bacterium]